MSPVFPLEQREEIQKRLLETGVCLIRKKGIRHMTVDDVTEQVGIGKGTFYHFFPSKEEYVSAVISFSKENLLDAINQIVEQNGGIDKTAFFTLFQVFSPTGRNNIISSMTSEDEEWLQRKLPGRYALDLPKEDTIVLLLLEHMIGVRKHIDPHVIANSIKIMALAVENRKILHQDALEQNLSLMQRALCDYIFYD